MYFQIYLGVHITNLHNVQTHSDTSRCISEHISLMTFPKIHLLGKYWENPRQGLNLLLLDSSPALLDRFRQHLLMLISTNKFPFYSLFSYSWQYCALHSAQCSAQDFGQFSQIMSVAPLRYLNRNLTQLSECVHRCCTYCDVPNLPSSGWCDPVLV